LLGFFVLTENNYVICINTGLIVRKKVDVTLQFQESGIKLEAQLIELASKNPMVGWLLDEYYSTGKHANTALQYVLQYGTQCGYILPQAVKLETQPTAFMNAYAARDSIGTPLIYVNTGLRFFLMMLNYSLAWAAFKNTASAGQSMNAILFTIVHGYWPPGIDLSVEMEAMRGFSKDEMHFITAWLPAQIFFIVAHEFAHHLIWSGQPGSTQVHKLPMLTSREIEIYNPSQKDKFRADEIVFDIWDKLDATLSGGFRAFTAGGLGALFGYFRILEEYTPSQSTSSSTHLPAVERYGRLKARLLDTGRVYSLAAMEETWAATEIIMEACLEAKETLWKQAKGEDLPNESS
jgi:hypothetical protein